ncbi:hypothetical protein AVEN_115362-1 [Araneus ventricosus]|uniref:Uncharacterized protein n=1 Tax=Araneus ventricosus TaxID=182803 RepID=A0A4Y1ZY64_ARAVE|nr:hypothetical protein AVEN_115362-1 [Araneus ventricosus]
MESVSGTFKCDQTEPTDSLSVETIGSSKRKINTSRKSPADPLQLLQRESLCSFTFPLSEINSNLSLHPLTKKNGSAIIDMKQFKIVAEEYDTSIACFQQQQDKKVIIDLDILKEEFL